MRTLTLISSGLLAAFLSCGNVLADDGSSSGKNSPAQIFNIDGVLYGCVPGSQAKGVALSKCTKLPTNVVNMISVSGSTVPTLSTSSTGTTTSTGTTGTTTATTSSGTNDDGDTAEVTVVGTPQGPKSCPVTAFNSSNQLDLTQCTDASKGKKIHAVCQPLSTSTTASTTASTTSSGTTGTTTTGTTTTSTTSTTASTTTGTTSGTTTSSPLLSCTMPGETQSKNPLPKFGTACPGGGSNQVTGGYDASTGKIDITITFTACIDERGVSHDGTAIMQGTLSADSSGANLYQLDETKTINSSLTFPTGGTMTRTCTVTRKGSYDNASGAFNGTVSRNNCTMTGAYRFKKGLVDNLIENAAEAEPI
jgi:hypothetical protein